MKKNGRQRFTFERETLIILLVISGGILVTLLGIMFDPNRTPKPLPSQEGKDLSVKGKSRSSSDIVSAAMVPLATGNEPIEKIFIQSGCAVCHTIPGIKVAQGKEGPKLVLGSSGRQRLTDTHYSGTATTVREYIIESILSPGTYIVSGYPDRVMPRWYGQKLSAQALEKIANYLERLTDSHNENLE